MHAAWLSARVPGQAELQMLRSGRTQSADKPSGNHSIPFCAVLAWREVRVQGASGETSVPIR